MNPKVAEQNSGPKNEIYKFLVENQLTEKTEEQFTEEYSKPEKAKELHDFFTKNELTTKGYDEFYGQYLKKKESAKVSPTIVEPVTEHLPEILPEKKSKPSSAELEKSKSALPSENKFDADGSGYDNQTAEQYGLGADETGHWQSRVELPKEELDKLSLPEGSGLILKGKGHETFDKTIKGEREAGFKIQKIGNRYYSIPEDFDYAKSVSEKIIKANEQRKIEQQISPVDEEVKRQSIIADRIAAEEKQKQYEGNVSKAESYLNYHPKNLAFESISKREEAINDMRQKGIPEDAAVEALKKYDNKKIELVAERRRESEIDKIAQSIPKSKDPLAEAEKVYADKAVQFGVENMDNNQREAYKVVGELEGMLKQADALGDKSKAAKIAELKQKKAELLNNLKDYTDPVTGEPYPEEEQQQMAVDQSKEEQELQKSTRDQLRDYYFKAYDKLQALTELYTTKQKSLALDVAPLVPDTWHGEEKQRALLLKNQYVEAKIDFEAATRVFLLNEDPGGVERDYGFKAGAQALVDELIPTAFTPSGRFIKTNKSFLESIQKITNDEQIKTSPEAKKRFEQTFPEMVVEGTLGLVGVLPKLMMAGEVVGAGEMLLGLDKAYKTWMAGSKVDKALAWTVRGLVEEGKMQGLQFEPGAGFGFHVAGGLKIPTLKGRLGIVLQPFVDKLIQGSVGATGGMELGSVFASAVSALESDKEFKEEMDKHFPDVETTTKRIMSELIMNSIIGVGHIKGKDFLTDPAKLVDAALDLYDKGYLAESAQLLEKAKQLSDIKKATKAKSGVEGELPTIGSQPPPVDDAAKPKEPKGPSAGNGGGGGGNAEPKGADQVVTKERPVNEQTFTMPDGTKYNTYEDLLKDHPKFSDFNELKRNFPGVITEEYKEAIGPSGSGGGMQPRPAPPKEGKLVKPENELEALEKRRDELIAREHHEKRLADENAPDWLKEQSKKALGNHKAYIEDLIRGKENLMKQNPENAEMYQEDIDKYKQQLKEVEDIDAQIAKLKKSEAPKEETPKSDIEILEQKRKEELEEVAHVINQVDKKKLEDQINERYDAELDKINGKKEEVKEANDGKLDVLPGGKPGSTLKAQTIDLLDKDVAGINEFWDNKWEPIEAEIEAKNEEIRALKETLKGKKGDAKKEIEAKMAKLKKEGDKLEAEFTTEKEEDYAWMVDYVRQRARIKFNKEIEEDQAGEIADDVVWEIFENAGKEANWKRKGQEVVDEVIESHLGEELKTATEFNKGEIIVDQRGVRYEVIGPDGKDHTKLKNLSDEATPGKIESFGNEFKGFKVDVKKPEAPKEEKPQPDINIKPKNDFIDEIKESQKGDETKFPRKDFENHPKFQQNKKQYDQSKGKKYGAKFKRKLPNGETITGKYVLINKNDVFPSHDSNNFKKKEGVPVNENGKTFNDNDYETNKGAQVIQREIAQKYDRQAIDDTPLWDNNGVVKSGNGRTISRQISTGESAKEYLEDLKDEAERFGFTKEDVEKIGDEDVMIGVELDGEPVYTTSEYAKFNAPKEKQKTPLQDAIKASKMIDEESSNKLLNIVGQVEQMSAMSQEMKQKLKQTLIDIGLINEFNQTLYFDEKNNLTEAGKEYLENILLANVFNETELGLLNSEGLRSVRNRLAFNKVHLTKNKAHADELNVIENIKRAIYLLNDLKPSSNNYAMDMIASIKQLGLFSENRITPQDVMWATILQSRNDIADVLKGLNETVAGEDLFGDKPTSEQRLNQQINEIYDKFKKADNKKSDIIDAAREFQKQLNNEEPEQKGDERPPQDIPGDNAGNEKDKDDLKSPEEKHTDEEDQKTIDTELARGFKVFKTFFRKKGETTWRKAYVVSSPDMTIDKAKHAAADQLIRDNSTTVSMRYKSNAAAYKAYEFKAEPVEPPSASGEYEYNMTLRPPSIGTHPSENFVRWEDDGTKFGKLIYSKKLSATDREHFSLTPITEAKELDGKVVTLEGTDYDYTLELKQNQKGTNFFEAVQYDETGTEVDREGLSVDNVLKNIESGRWLLNNRPKAEKPKAPTETGNKYADHLLDKIQAEYEKLGWKDAKEVTQTLRESFIANVDKAGEVKAQSILEDSLVDLLPKEQRNGAYAKIREEFQAANKPTPPKAGGKIKFERDPNEQKKLDDEIDDLFDASSMVKEPEEKYGKEDATPFSKSDAPVQKSTSTVPVKKVGPNKKMLYTMAGNTSQPFKVIVYDVNKNANPNSRAKNYKAHTPQIIDIITFNTAKEMREYEKKLQENGAQFRGDWEQGKKPTVSEDGKEIFLPSSAPGMVREPQVPYGKRAFDDGFAKALKIAEAVIKKGLYKYEDLENLAISKGKEDMLPDLEEAYKEIRDTYDLSHEVKTSLDNDRQIEQAKAARKSKAKTPGVEGGPTPTGTDRGGSKYRRPPIRIADEENLPEPEREYVVRDQYEIDEHQRFAVNLALNRFLGTSKNAGDGFLLADGAGVGKTREILVTAEEYRKATGKKVLIVSLQGALKDSFPTDAKALGIDLKNFEMGTYSNLTKGLIGKGEYGLVIYDESHNLKNEDTAKAKAAAAIKTEKELFASATPIDKPIHAVYFLHKITGMTQQEIKNELGITIEFKEDWYGKIVPMVTCKLGEDHYFKKLIELRNKAIESGAMVRREYPFAGETINVVLDTPPEAKLLEDQVTKIYNDRDDNATNIVLAQMARKVATGGNPKGPVNDAVWKTEFNKLKKDLQNKSGSYATILDKLETFKKKEKINYMKALDAINETHKADEIFKQAMEDVKAGKQVVIVGNYVGKHKIEIGSEKGADGYFFQEVPAEQALLNKMKAMFAKEGIKVAEIFGGNEGDTKYKREQDKFQKGETPVLLMTAKSGGTGINLDDVVGNKPRVMYMATAEYGGDIMAQVIGRVSRRNTMSAAMVKVMYFLNAADTNRKEKSDAKLQTITAITGGEDLDLGRLRVDSKLKEEEVDEEGNVKPKVKASAKATIEEVGDKIQVYGPGTFPIKDKLKALGAKPKGKQGDKGFVWELEAQHLEAVKKIVEGSKPEEEAPDAPLAASGGFVGKSRRAGKIKGNQSGVNPHFQESDLENVVRLRDITKRMLKNMGYKENQTIRTGLIKRFTRKALGLYFPNSGIIRLKNMQDVEVLTHEIGHKIDYEVFQFTNQLTTAGLAQRRAMQKELIDMLKSYGYPDVSTKEGVAEFVRHYVIDKAYAQGVAPEFFNFFENLLGSNANLRNAFDIIQKDVADFKKQSPEQILESKIQREGEESEGWISGITKAAKGFEYHVFESIKPLRELSKLMDENRLNTSSGTDPLNATLSLLGVDGKAKQFLENHPFYKNGDDVVIEKHIPGLLKIIKPFIADGTIKAREGYLVALRNIELHQRAFNAEQELMELEYLKSTKQDRSDRIDELVNEPNRTKGEDQELEDLIMKENRLAELIDIEEFLKKEKGLTEAATMDWQESDHIQTTYENKYGQADLQKFADQIYEYQDAVLRYYKDSGKLSEEDYIKMKDLNQFYVPLKRFFEDYEMDGSTNIGKALTSADSPSPVKGIKGSERDIISPLESMLKNTYDLLAAADKNTALKSLVKALKAIDRMNKDEGNLTEGAIVQEIPQHKVVAQRQANGEMAYVVIKKNPNEEIPKGHIISTYTDGEVHYYAIPKDYYDSFFSVNEKVADWIRIASLPSRWLQKGAVVYDPTFAFRNVFRDQVTALFYSNHGYSPADFVRGISSAIKRDDMYQKWMASGADMSFLTAMDDMMSKGYLNQRIGSKLETKWATYKKNPFAILSDFNRASEMGSRVGSFRNAYLKTGDAYVAMKESREIGADYGVVGKSVKALAPLLPFFNARLQHLKKTKEAFVEHPGRTVFKGVAYVTIPSILNWLYNNMDDESRELYQALPTWRRVGMWNVRIPDTEHFFSIPKGTFGVAFGSSVESLLDNASADDERTGQQLANQLFQELAPGTNLPDFLPQIIRPASEIWANKNAFTGRPVVSENLLSKDAAEQFNGSTPEVIKAVGAALDMSPLKIEKVIQGYGGGAVSGAVRLIDETAQGMGMVESRPEDTFTKLSRLPLLKAFMTETPTGTRSSYVQDFYEKLDKMNEIDRTVNGFVADENAVKANEYLDAEKHPERVKDYLYFTKNQKDINKFRGALGALKQVQRGIMSDKDLSSEQKAEDIKAIDNLITKTAIEFRKAYKENRAFDYPKVMDDQLKELKKEKAKDKAAVIKFKNEIKNKVSESKK